MGFVSTQSKKVKLSSQDLKTRSSLGAEASNTSSRSKSTAPEAAAASAMVVSSTPGNQQEVLMTETDANAAVGDIKVRE